MAEEETKKHFRILLAGILRLLILAYLALFVLCLFVGESLAGAIIVPLGVPFLALLGFGLIIAGQSNLPYSLLFLLASIALMAYGLLVPKKHARILFGVGFVLFFIACLSGLPPA
jgi:hypothetical protein